LKSKRFLKQMLLQVRLAKYTIPLRTISSNNNSVCDILPCR